MNRLMIGLAAGAVVGVAQAARLAENGKTDYVISIAADATATDKFAAEELQLHLKASTGADFAIVAETKGGKAIELGTAAAKKIVCGDCAKPMKNEACAYAIKGDKVGIVGGGTTGNAYGVYAFLERELGVRWYTWKGDDLIPPHPVLDVKDTVHSECPKFKYRHIIMQPTAVRPDGKDALFAFRNRLNQLGDNFEHMRRKDLIGKLPVQMRMSQPGCHSLFYYVPPDPVGKRSGYFSDRAITNGYFEAHPEYYTMTKDGKRVKNRQLCFSNPGLRRTLTENFMRRLPEVGEGFMDLSAQDVPDSFCECPDCKALEKKYQSLGGPLFDFLFELAPKVKASHPGIRIHFLVYRKEQTQRPPKMDRPWPDNLVAIFANIDSDFSKDYLHKNNLDTYEDLKSWCRLVPTWAWYYPFSYGGNNPPIGMLRKSSVDTRLMYEAGLTGTFYEHDVGTFNGMNFADAMTWMLTQLYRDPYKDWRALRDEFFTFYYGAAAKDMIAFDDELEKMCDDCPFFLSWCGGAPGVFTPEQLVRWNRLFDRMEKTVAKDAKALQHVREARLGVETHTIKNWKKIRKAKLGKGLSLEAILVRSTNTIWQAVVERYPDNTSGHRQPHSNPYRKAMVELANCAKLDVKPLPGQFRAFGEKNVVEVLPMRGQAMEGYTEYVEDKTAPSGYALVETMNPASKMTFPIPFGFYDGATRKFLADNFVKAGTAKEGEWFLQKLPRVPIASTSCFAYLGWSWATQAKCNDCYRPGSDDWWDVYMEIKVTGPKFYPDSKAEKSTFSYGRLICVGPYNGKDGPLVTNWN